MTEVIKKPTNVPGNDDNNTPEKLQASPSKLSSPNASNFDDNLQLNGHHDSEEDAPKRVMRRIQQFSESDSDKEVTQNAIDKLGSQKESKIPQNSDDISRSIKKSRIRKAINGSSSDSDSSNTNQAATNTKLRKKSKLPLVSDDNSNAVISRNIPPKSPIQKATSDSDSSNSNQALKGTSKIPLGSDSDSDTSMFKSIPPKSQMTKLHNSSSDSDQAVKNDEQQTRMKNKRNKMKDKFKNLLTSRGKGKLSAEAEWSPEKDLNKDSNSTGDSDDNDDAGSSIEKIKQKIKERMSYKPSICDPDTSDEETEYNHQKSMPKQKKERRIKLTSPKPQRMSAKQAMENMQKIKSESNRMLREKEVSLPYHRPKALSLKDIMSRRKPAMSSDGKCLPIKMNGEQLKQYAQMLEDRQKQMMELWQSDTDEENDDIKLNENDDKISDDIKLDEKTDDDKNQETETIIDDLKEIESDSENAKKINADISTDNDKLFDVLSQSIIEGTKANDSIENESTQLESMNESKVSEEQNSETNMKLVFNDSETSITEEKQDTPIILEGTPIHNIEANKVNETDKNNENQVLEGAKPSTEPDSQLISLHYGSEKTEIQTEHLSDKDNEAETVKTDETENTNKEIEAMDVDGFSDDDMNIEDIDNIIENAEIIRDIEDKVNSQVLIRDRPLNPNPKLTGVPGMVIDLDDSDTLPKKSGVELLKERFTFFSKLKTPEEFERNKERQIKPGNQHSRLKQELEDQMAVQRSLEWAKRLADDNQQQKELKELRGEESDENDIDKIEAKLEEENEDDEAACSESEEEELLENDIEMKDKPRAKNPMLENEAEVSDCEETEGLQQNGDDENEVNDDCDEIEDDAESSDDSESSESEEEQPTTKKGRILKAFEDSDDEDMKVMETKDEAKSVGSVELLASQPISQDDVLTLAQRHKSLSEDLFTSQGSSLLASQKLKSQAAPESLENDVNLGTQTFSILDSTTNTTAEFLIAASLSSSDKLNVICETQPCYDNLDAVAAMCSGSFSQSLPPLPITQVSQSQPIGEDILALCTGKFYENEFVSQVEENIQTPLGESQEYDSQEDKGDEIEGHIDHVKYVTVTNTVVNNTQHIDKNKLGQSKIVMDDNLKSILDELDDPEFDTPKANKFFCGGAQKQTEDTQKEVKKKLIIDSDDDADASETKKRKKLKKKKPEKRALQISDDEEEEEISEVDEYESEIEEENEARLVEYDSEENEIEVKPLNKKPSKKRKGTEFFEQEAELTSEDEWAGSGDEDEAGLDRMEREAGDDESFHQGRLQRELGQIHMREVIDQDKREVRIIQELLFEDGDLGAGGRQRKFKWKNLDGDEETGTDGDEFRDTQEEEFESEEQWRKQRHERETFLRQMKNNSELDDSLNVSINRTTIIKANLMSKTMSMVLAENQPAINDTEDPVEEMKTKNIPSPKKPFSLIQQSYQGSILNRGKGALARLAALATPLAVDDDAPKGKSAATSSRRNFVFATLTPEAPKVTKRKAGVNPGTPALVKKMKTEEKQNMSKSRLLDHMKV